MEIETVVHHLNVFESMQCSTNNTSARSLSIPDPISLSDFLLLAVLGKGSYAKVVLVRKVDTGQVFAMKILKKSKMTTPAKLTHVKMERDILVCLNTLLSSN